MSRKRLEIATPYLRHVLLRASSEQLQAWQEKPYKAITALRTRAHLIRVALTLSCLVAGLALASGWSGCLLAGAAMAVVFWASTYALGLYATNPEYETWALGNSSKEIAHDLKHSSLLAIEFARMLSRPETASELLLYKLQGQVPHAEEAVTAPHRL